MMRIRFLTIAVVLLLGAGSQAFAIKPTPPLKLSLSHIHLTDGQIELTLQALANITTEKVEFVIDLPPSVSLVSGEVKWDGAIAAGEKKIIKAFVRTIANIPAEATGKATVYFLGGGSVIQQSALLLNAPKEKAPPPLSPIKRRQNGRTILEFKGK